MGAHGPSSREPEAGTEVGFEVAVEAGVRAGDCVNAKGRPGEGKGQGGDEGGCRDCGRRRAGVSVGTGAEAEAATGGCHGHGDLQLL